MAKHWIKSAIKRPGQLHRDLGVPQGKKIPRSKIVAALAGRYGAAAKKRAQLARILGKMRK